LGIEDGLVSPKHFCDFLPIKIHVETGMVEATVDPISKETHITVAVASPSEDH